MFCVLGVFFFFPIVTEIGSFFLVGCNPGHVLGFGVLGSFGFFFFFFFFSCDQCVKEEVGMVETSGFGLVGFSVEISGFWVWIGAVCGALSVASMVGFWLGLN